MGKHIGTGGLARGKILGRLAFYTWVSYLEYKKIVITLYWSMLLWSVSSLGKVSTTVTWSRHTSPTHSTGFIFSMLYYTGKVAV